MSIAISRIISILPDYTETYQIGGRSVTVRKISHKDISEYTGRKGLKRLPCSTKNALIAAIQCSEKADIEKKPSAVGVFVASSMSYIENTRQFMADTYGSSAMYVSPLSFPNTVLNSVSGWVSIVLGITGLNMTINTGGTSALDALKIAVDYLNYGVIDSAIVLATEEITPTIVKSDYPAKILYSEATIALLLKKIGQDTVCAVKDVKTKYSRDNLWIKDYCSQNSSEDSVLYLNSDENPLDHPPGKACDTYAQYGECFAVNSFIKLHEFTVQNQYRKAIIIEDDPKGSKGVINLEKELNL